ncbi:hypothetical protein GCM10029964_034430 [Kibdelosporangium lantanae]
MTYARTPADGVVSAEKKEIHDVYQEIATEYDERIPGFTALDEQFAENEREFILDHVGPDHAVLDIGCGTGRLTLPLAERAGSVTGLDMSDAMLAQARAKAGERGLSVDFRQGDMTAMPFADASFDVVVSMLALMHIPVAERGRLFAEITRVLRPGGQVLVGVKNGVFERLSRADRFATVDVTDVDRGELVFTDTKSGVERRAGWHSFTPADLRRLAALNGLVPVALRGNIPLSAWLDNSLLADAGVQSAVRSVERAFSDVPPLNEIGYHILFEAVKPLAR